MGNILNGKFLTSRMFISVCLLVFAIYLFSLAVQKKQGSFHSNEILRLNELVAELVDNKEEMSSLFSKVKLLPAANSSENSDLTTEKIFDYDKYLESQDWQMFSWIQNKSWLDVVQAKLPKSSFNISENREVLLNLFQSRNLKKIRGASPIDVIRFSFYSELVHLPEQRLNTILKYQGLIGLLYFYYPKESKILLKNIYLLSVDMEGQKFIEDRKAVVSKRDIQLFDIMDYLLKFEPVVLLGTMKPFSWYYSSQLSCQYSVSNEKTLMYLAIAEIDLKNTTKSYEERFEQHLDRKKSCRQDIIESRLEFLKEKLIVNEGMGLPSGKWDLGKKYKNQNHFLNKLRADMQKQLSL